jgi:hypothetical protein
MVVFFQLDGLLTEPLLHEWFARSPATTTSSCFNGLLIEQMLIIGFADRAVAD